MSLTPEQFIIYLRKTCKERIEKCPVVSTEFGRNQAFEQIIASIDVYIKEFCDRPIVIFEEIQHEKH